MIFFSNVIPDVQPASVVGRGGYVSTRRLEEWPWISKVVEFFEFVHGTCVEHSVIASHVVYFLQTRG